MKEEEYILFDTGLGTCGIAWRVTGKEGDGAVVTRFQLPEATGALIAARAGGELDMAERVPPPIAAIIRRVQQHFSGDPQDFSGVAVALDTVTDFSRAVYAAARNIPAGQTMTYGEVARKIKRPRAARAVGQALARNPIPLIIPCHRVLAADGRPGGFSAPGGLATKKRMLVGEGALQTGQLKK